MTQNVPDDPMHPRLKTQPSRQMDPSVAEAQKQAPKDKSMQSYVATTLHGDKALRGKK